MVPIVARFGAPPRDFLGAYPHQTENDVAQPLDARGSSASSRTASKRQGGACGSRARYRLAAATRRARLAAVMLAAAPPKSRRRRSRTSTNTSVSPSRATRSSSPQRRRQLRSTIARPRARESARPAPRPPRRPPRAEERGVPGVGGHRRDSRPSAVAGGGDDLAVAELQQRRLADELARAVEREMAGRAVELERRRRAVDEGLRDAKGVDTQREQPIERGIAVIAAGDLGERGGGGIGEPRDLDEDQVVELAQRRARLPVVHLAARVGGRLPEVRAWRATRPARRQRAAPRAARRGANSRRSSASISGERSKRRAAAPRRPAESIRRRRPRRSASAAPSRRDHDDGLRAVGGARRASWPPSLSMARASV